MGLDLRLLPLDGCDFSHTMLSCDRCPELFKLVLELEERFGKDVPRGFKSFAGSAYGLTSETAYGVPIKTLRVEQLYDLTKYVCTMDSRLNKGVWAYLHELPMGTPVALYWH